MVLVFERMFLLAGLLFLGVLPLLIFLKSPDHDAAEQHKPVELHVEA
jgi:hypothetical protein